VILVSNFCNPEIVRAMHLLQAPDLETALAMARERAGKNADIIVIPDGVSVIVSD
jgi:nickel-dependent lactate racemase